MKKMAAVLVIVAFMMTGCASLATNWSALMDSLCSNYTQYADRIKQARNALEESRNLLVSVLDDATLPEYKLTLIGGLTILIAGLDQITSIGDRKCLVEADVAEANAVVATVEANKMVRSAKMIARKLRKI